MRDEALPACHSHMIVCSCNVLSERDVRSAVAADSRPRTAGQVYGCLGCSPQCGRCARTIKRIVDEALGLASEPPEAGSCDGCPRSAAKARAAQRRALQDTAAPASASH